MACQFSARAILKCLQLAAAGTLSLAGCETNHPTSVRDLTTHRNALVRWIPVERAISDAIAGIDAEATAQLIALLEGAAAADLGVDRVSQFQISFRDHSSDGSGAGLSGILRASWSHSGSPGQLLPYQSRPGEWSEISSLTSGPHLRLQPERVSGMAAQLQKWLAGHGARGAVAEDVQVELVEGGTRLVMRGALRSEEPNHSMLVVVACLEGCRQ